MEPKRKSTNMDTISEEAHAELQRLHHQMQGIMRLALRNQGVDPSTATVNIQTGEIQRQQQMPQRPPMPEAAQPQDSK